MARPDIYEEIYQYSKEYIVANSSYSPKVGKSAPTEAKDFPLVIIPECKMTLNEETLKKGQQKYKLTFEVEIYAIDTTVEGKAVARQTIVEELEKIVYEIFEEHYGMRGLEAELRPNADTNVMRVYIEFRSVVDHKNIIYRR